MPAGGMPPDTHSFDRIPMSYYAHHVFFCCNQREGGRVCCNDKGASRLRDYAKQRVKELGLAGQGKTRINQAGCLDRCEEGPCIVVYPEETWYTYVDEHDIDEIIEEHLQHGRVVERLKI
jgi:(2Fe-2S) ferredoxin